MIYVVYIFLGVLAGTLGGMFGIGGGIVLIPILVYFFGLTQHQAQGTMLTAMVPPITFFAAMRYYQNGNVKLGMAGFICVGFFVGAYFGAGFVQNLPDVFLKRLFGILLFVVSLRLIFIQ